MGGKLFYIEWFKKTSFIGCHLSDLNETWGKRISGYVNSKYKGLEAERNRASLRNSKSVSAAKAGRE